VSTLINFSAISWREQVNFHRDDDEVRFVLDQHAELDFYSINALKQQSTDRHVTPLKTYNRFFNELHSPKNVLYMLYMRA
jgi:hypothetical protein